jgi:hypothetical protein
MRSFFTSLRRFAETIGFGFCRLTEIQYSAPWSAPRSRCGCWGEVYGGLLGSAARSERRTEGRM